MMEQAKGGDAPSARIVLDKFLPNIRSAAPNVKIDLPVLKTIDNLNIALEKIGCTMADGEISVTDANEFAQFVENKRKFIETKELAVEVQKLTESKR